MPPMIDLTEDSHTFPTLALITRFPPSISGSARAASSLVSSLVGRYGIPVEVIRLIAPGEAPASGPPVVMDLDPGWEMSGSQAARRAGRCDVVLLDIDRHVPIDLVDNCVSELDMPVIVMVDDVGRPDDVETGRLAELARRVDTVVVRSETARRRLHDLTSGEVRVEVVLHGSPWRAAPPNPGMRRTILTWGFLEPGTGAERVIRALARLGDLRPHPRFRLVGIADPAWTSQEAHSYREELVEVAANLGVADMVQVSAIHHAESDLWDEVEHCDLVAVTYDSRDRSASRVLCEALSCGRPVVATAFPGAVEMLGTGAGLTVAHDDDEELADALRAYLTDDDKYANSVRIASSMSPMLQDEEVARRLSLLITELATHVTHRLEISP